MPLVETPLSSPQNGCPFFWGGGERTLKCFVTPAGEEEQVFLPTPAPQKSRQETEKKSFLDRDVHTLMSRKKNVQSLLGRAGKKFRGAVKIGEAEEEEDFLIVFFFSFLSFQREFGITRFRFTGVIKGFPSFPSSTHFSAYDRKGYRVCQKKKNLMSILSLNCATLSLHLLTELACILLPIFLGAQLEIY